MKGASGYAAESFMATMQILSVIYTCGLSCFYKIKMLLPYVEPCVLLSECYTHNKIFHNELREFSQSYVLEQYNTSDEEI